jgi:periplasmic protein TonB
MTASAVVIVVDGQPGTFNRILNPPVSANNDDVVYFEFQVQKHVTVLPGAPTPAYPIELRSANVEGSVLVQFVVDASGMADTTTIKVLKSTHDLFTSSVRATIPFIHFTPAEVGGRKVKQLVQMPFQFSLTRTPPPTR